MPLPICLPVPSPAPPLSSEVSIPLPALQYLQTLLPDTPKALLGILQSRSYGEVTTGHLQLKEARQKEEAPHRHPLPSQSTRPAL